MIFSDPASVSRPISACQACGHAPLHSVLFLGYAPPVNTMPVIGTVAVEQPAFPLELLRCEKCTLVQIGLEVDKRVLFPPEYPYLSSSTRVLRDNFADLFAESQEILVLGSTDLVVDIGSNDGTLLSNFRKGGIRVLGIEPTQAAMIANEQGIPTWNKFFDADVVGKVREAHGPARMVTAANVFAHIADVHAVLEAVVSLLGPQGVFVSESHYLLPLVQTLQYDTIYHEHLRYYSVGSLVPLLAGHGLEVFHVKRIPSHGGSVRVYAGRPGENAARPSVAAALAEEARAGLADGSAFDEFRRRTVLSKLGLLRLLAPLRMAGERVYGIGAPSRASTLINYVGFDDGLLDCVLEISASKKLGKYMPGTRIPVLDEEKLFRDQPEYALLLSWHIQDELATALRGKGYRGRFITPLPEPAILSC